MWSSTYPRSVYALRADALFASALQRSGELSISQVRQAIAAALDAYGGTGCAGRVAQEFGDHPETALARMRWAHATVAVLGGRSPRGRSAVEDELIRVCALAARLACQRMTPRYLKALDDSVEQACGMPARYYWDRKATAHAEIVNHLADAAGDPVLALLLRNISGQLYDLMVTVGPASGGIIASSRHRLLALMRAGDGDGAAREMEQHLGSLLWMRRLCRGSQK